MRNKKALRITIALTLALLMALSVTAPAFAAVERQASNSLTVYYVAKDGKDLCLVRENHPTNHRIVNWFALNEVLRGQAQTPGVLKPFNPNTWVKSIVTVQGRTTVDFTAKIFRNDVSWSVRQLALQGLVNTLTELPGIKQVRFTVNGTQYDDLYRYRTRDLSQVRDGGQVTVKPSIKLNIGEWKWISSPLAVKGRTDNFSGLVLVELKDYSGRSLSRNWAWVDEGANGFNVRLTYNTPKDWVGSLTLQSWNASDWSKGPSLDVPVLFSR